MRSLLNSLSRLSTRSPAVNLSTVSRVVQCLKRYFKARSVPCMLQLRYHTKRACRRTEKMTCTVATTPTTINFRSKRSFTVAFLLVATAVLADVIRIGEYRTNVPLYLHTVLFMRARIPCVIISGYQCSAGRDSSGRFTFFLQSVHRVVCVRVLFVMYLFRQEILIFPSGTLTTITIQVI